MANARAIANGNWSSTSTWNGWLVPGNGDTVYANGFNVTLDTNINIGGANNPIVNTGSLVSGQWYEIVNVGGQTWTTLGAASNTVGTVFQSTGTGTAGNLGTARALATLTTATNTAAGATTGGGVFTMSTVRAMTADLRAGTTTCLNVTATSGNLNLSGIRAVPGGSAGAHGINNNSTAAVDISACNFTGGGTAVAAFAFNNASTGDISISNSTFTGGNTTNTTAFNNAAAAVVTVNASTFAGGSGNSTSYGINNALLGSINCTNCTFLGGGGLTANGINNASIGSITISGSTFTAGVGPAFNNASTGTLIIATSTFTASANSNAVNIANTSADVRLSGDFLDHWSGWKAVSGGKWRLGTAPTLGQTRYALAGTTDSYFTMYGADNGAFGNPIAANVRSGVSYGGGNLTGTCAVPSAGSVALGVPVDATTGTAVLTPEAVWGHASRTITEGGITAADVWSHASRTITGGTVTTLTNAPSVPSAASIRAEIDSNSTQLSAIKSKTDALPASPAATGDIPTESEIAAEVWAKPTTELTITGSIGERAKNQSTVSTTGAQLAAALS